jgi:uncharacterized small protein (DUF1192 family)
MSTRLQAVLHAGARRPDGPFSLNWLIFPKSAARKPDPPKTTRKNIDAKRLRELLTACRGASKEEVDRLNEELAVRNKETDTLTNTITMLEKEIQKLTTEMQTPQNQTEILRTWSRASMKRLLEMRTASRQEYDRLNKELAECRVGTDTLINRITMLKKEIKSLKAEMPTPQNQTEIPKETRTPNDSGHASRGTSQDGVLDVIEENSERSTKLNEKEMTSDMGCEGGKCWIKRVADNKMQGGGERDKETTHPATQEYHSSSDEKRKVMNKYQHLLEDAQKSRQYLRVYFNETEDVANVWNTLKRDVEAANRKEASVRYPAEVQLVELFEEHGETWRSLLVTDPPDEKIQLYPPDVLVDDERAANATRKYLTMYEEAKAASSADLMGKVWYALNTDVDTVKNKDADQRSREENALLLLFKKYEHRWKSALLDLFYIHYSKLFPRPIEEVD